MPHGVGFVVAGFYEVFRLPVLTYKVIRCLVVQRVLWL
jgi:hypothetical protein